MRAASSKEHRSEKSYAGGKVPCNICQGPFRPSTPYMRFCPSCRKSSRVYRMVEWLPEHIVVIH